MLGLVGGMVFGLGFRRIRYDLFDRRMLCCSLLNCGMLSRFLYSGMLSRFFYSGMLSRFFDYLFHSGMLGGLLGCLLHSGMLSNSLLYGRMLGHLLGRFLNDRVFRH